jgi:ATP-dependent DNA helicase RecG
VESLANSIQYLKGVGPRRARYLHNLGVDKVFDLLWYIPRAYYDRNNKQAIATLPEGENAAIRGFVRATQGGRSRKGMHIFKALIQDDSATVNAVWFNQPFMADLIKPGQELFLQGRLRTSYSFSEFQVSEYEILDGDMQGNGVTPVYALTEGINQKFLRKLMEQVLKDYVNGYPEILSSAIREKYRLADIGFSLRNIHFPSSREAYARARRRLAVEELLLFNLRLRRERPDHVSGQYVVSQDKNDLVARVRKGLPFDLTAAQQRVLGEIFADMEAPRQMNRLLQGDVGSGKTVISALAAAKAVASGYQSAFMAPTEILAEQHFRTLTHLLPDDLVMACLTGSCSTAMRRSILEALAEGQIDILIGTHALLEEEVAFSALGLVIIDEQHRFGVRQRAALGSKGNHPDILVMTATPIPRTLALTVYGDLAQSTIDELPPGRKPVKTVFVRSNQRKKAYQLAARLVREKGQVYVVCPLVEESEKQDLQAAVQLYEELRNDIFPWASVGLMHGRLKSAEKERVMEQFRQGKIDMLVSTTVIEVGVDIPNASLMIVEHAERFGLSQLHQLRGRVGRGERESFCILIGNPSSEEALARLRAMESTADGFKLAQEDLRLRGPGDFWGVRQHGLEQLKVADLVKDQYCIELAHRLISSETFTALPEMEFYLTLKFGDREGIAAN